MTKQYKMAVVIGRFSGLHKVHVELIRRASDIADKVVVLVGSAYQPRTYKNPWTYNERAALIRNAMLDVGVVVETLPLEDNVVDAVWAKNAIVAVEDHFYNTYRTIDKKGEVALVGHEKDDSSFYLRMFDWDLVKVESLGNLSATNIRDLYFREDANLDFLENVVPNTTKAFLKAFRTTEAYEQLIRERKYIEDYKKQFAMLPYPPVFVTVDAVVECQARVLLVKRRAEPGRGLWALPGGFLDAGLDRSIENAMIRELKEETGIKVPEPVLRGCIKDKDVFDQIDRSARGRTITHAFHLQLGDGIPPKVRGQDDAEKAAWVHVADIRPEEMFEDHFSIIQRFINI